MVHYDPRCNRACLCSGYSFKIAARLLSPLQFSPDYVHMVYTAFAELVLMRPLTVLLSVKHDINTTH